MEANDAHAREYAAAISGMADTYGTDSPRVSPPAGGVQKLEPGTATVHAGTFDSAPLAEGMAVEGTGWWGTVEWIDDDRVMVCTEPRHAWIAYSRSEVRRAAR
jgi:hypothetical protein